MIVPKCDARCSGAVTCQREGGCVLSQSGTPLTRAQTSLDNSSDDMPAAPPTRGESFAESAAIFVAGMTSKSAPDYLEEAAATYRERNKLYGDNYKFFGHVMFGMFPDGLVLKTVEDFNRLGVLVQCASKLTRYAQNMHVGGHEDSALDLTTYAAMLRELTQKV